MRLIPDKAIEIEMLEQRRKREADVLNDLGVVDTGDHFTPGLANPFLGLNPRISVLKCEAAKTIQPTRDQTCPSIRHGVRLHTVGMNPLDYIPQALLMPIGQLTFLHTDRHRVSTQFRDACEI